MAGSSIEIRIYAAADAAEICVASWDALAEEAMLANPFYASWNLLPALRYLSGGRKVDVLTAWQDGVLAGLVPVHYRLRLRGLTVASVWKHSECYQTMPLLRSEAVWTAMLDGLWRERGVRVLHNSTQAGMPLCLHDKQHIVRLRYRRPLLQAGQSYRQLQAHWKGKVRRERQRLERRFFENDSAVYSNHKADAVARLEQYIRLEAQGWKGLSGSAIAQNESLCAYYRAMAQAAGARSAIEVQCLARDGQAAAMSIRLLSGVTAYEIKTSFDSNQISLAPGVVLELQNMRALCEREDLQRADSCTNPNNALITQLWDDSLAVYNSVYFAPGRVAALLRRFLSGYFYLKALKHRVRAWRPGRPNSFTAGAKSDGR
ncbi:GNAT family N-acetyltransferase [Granulosicoccaceae sp. 1_MG-2023]|nr:GNAT family N-acetyltransferase [Granulosicoccaceae sp. 1_MG-2023]